MSAELTDRLFAAQGLDKVTKIHRLTGILERVEDSIHRFHDRLLSDARLSSDPEVATALREIEQDFLEVRSLCVSHVMRREPKEELKHDLVNNEITLSLYQKLWDLIPTERTLKTLHDRQRAIYTCLQRLGVRVSKNASF